jgi:hypothetical protein
MNENEAIPMSDSAQHPSLRCLRDQMEQRMRAARAMGFLEALELDDAEASRLRETLTRHDDQRKPLMRQVHDSMLVLCDAASGDKAAQRQVDESVRRVFDARAKLESLDREMYQEIARDLDGVLKSSGRVASAKEIATSLRPPPAAGWSARPAPSPWATRHRRQRTAADARSWQCSAK